MKRASTGQFVAACCALGLPCIATAGDWAPAPDPAPPRSSPAALVPEVQTDDFSCGYHALAAVYRSYGLDPEAARLRRRLGTSVPAIPFLKDSNGTLHPDLFRVLRQDGFHNTFINTDDPEELDRLIAHLKGEHYALALVRTERAGGMHWIVFTDFADGLVTVGDSLRTGLQQESLAALAGSNLMSAILLEPGIPRPGSPFAGPHLFGIWAMSRSAVDKVTILVIITALVLVPWLAIRLLRFLCRFASGKRKSVSATDGGGQA